MAAEPDSESRKLTTVLMTADAAGGVWQYSIDLSAALAERGIEVVLATLGPRPSEEQRRQFAGIAKGHLFESDFPLEWMPNAFAEASRCGQWLLELEQQFKPGVIHLNGYALASLAWSAPVLVVGHSCVYSWWRAVHQSAPTSDWLEYRRRVTEGLSACQAIAAPSRYMAGAIGSEYGVDAEKIAVIHNFSAAVEQSGETKKPFALAAGRMWDPAKNLKSLDLIAGRIEWPLYVAGSNEGPEPGKSSTEAVYCLGSLPHGELLTQMAHASIFVHPALYEPFGLSVLEAARAGCCLVLSDIPSLRELWNGAARFVEPRDIEGWVRELNRLIADTSEREEWAARAHLHSERYDIESSIKQYSRIYAALLAGKTANNGVAVA